MSQPPPPFPSGFTRPEIPAYQAEAPIYRSIAVSNPLTSDVDRSVDPTWGDSYVHDKTQTNTKELTATSYVGQPITRQVPTLLKQLGTFYQPSSLICATSIADAWTSIISHFYTQRVEFTSDVNKAKLRGLFPVPHDSSLIHFRLRLYNASHLYPDSTTSIIAIEIQRRMGCIVAFHDFFRTCATAMGDRLLTTPLPVAPKPMPVLKSPPSTSSSTSTSSATSTTSTTTSSSSSSSSSSSLATLPLPDHSEVELDSTTLTTLTRQLHSKDLITNRTAMSALAHITYHHPSNQNILIQEITTQHATTPITTPTSTLPSSASLVTIILHLLHTHHDADLHRGAAMVLANLCEHSRFVELVVVSPPLIQALFTLLDIHATYKTPTTTSSIPPSLFTPLLERDCHRAIASLLHRCSNAHPQLFLQSMTTASSSHPQGLQHYLYLLDFFRDRANDGHDIACANQWDATRRLCTAH